MNAAPRLPDIPSLLPSSAHLLERMQDELVSLDELAQLIALDPALTSKLLRVANSAFFGMGGRVSLLEEAITVIGLSNTRGFIVADVLMKQFRKNPWAQIDLRAYWDHSLCMASVAQILAHRTSLSPSLAFSVGLLHRIGVLILSAQLGPSYLELTQERLSGFEFAEREREQFRISHTEVGANLLAKWHLPQLMVDAVRNQFAEPASHMQPPQAKLPTAAVPNQEHPVDIATECLRCGHDVLPSILRKKPLELPHLKPEHLELFQWSPDNFEQTLRAIRAKYRDMRVLVELE